MIRGAPGRDQRIAVGGGVLKNLHDRGAATTNNENLH